jgi:hypothetical protein
MLFILGIRTPDSATLTEYFRRCKFYCLPALWRNDKEGVVKNEALKSSLHHAIYTIQEPELEIQIKGEMINEERTNERIHSYSYRKY